MARIEFSMGALSFAAEGDEKWVASQFTLALEKFETLAPVSKESSRGDNSPTGPSEEEAVGSLAAHLKSKNAEAVQNRKFLATADWLRRKGTKTLKTGLITGALKEAHQKRLGNASQALANNVSQGFIEKDGSSFYITQEGLHELGYNV